jgi:hypothetical protein
MHESTLLSLRLLGLLLRRGQAGWLVEECIDRVVASTSLLPLISAPLSSLDDHLPQFPPIDLKPGMPTPS